MPSTVCRNAFRRALLAPLTIWMLVMSGASIAADPPLVVAHEIVLAWNAIDADAIADLFTEDGTYQSMMDKPTKGREVIREKFTALLSGATYLKLHLRNIAVQGNVVFLERVDEFVYKGKEASVPVVAVLEIEDGKVAEWREYFDRAELMEAMGMGH
ncbi:MAG: limonene-1,2-epoxide hydrolase family protein [Congregibacter sp.]